MKKIIALLVMLFAMSMTVHAEETVVARHADIPNLIPLDEEVSLLSGDESARTLTEVILDAFENKAEYIDITECKIPYTQADFDEVFDLYCTLVYHHPEYGDLRTYLEPGEAVYIGGMWCLGKIKPGRIADYDEAAYHRAIEYSLSKTLSPGMTDMDKILSIHDFLCEKITYSTQKFPVYDDDGNDTGTTAFGEWVYTPYSALVNYDAVCQGYALAFKLLCNYAGIDCGFAISTIELHIWNVVEYDGAYYHLDATWDDKEDFILHKYFMLSDDENKQRRKGGYAASENYEWTNDRLPCSTSGLNDSLYCGNKIDPFTWRDGKFWYTCRGFLELVPAVDEPDILNIYNTPRQFYLSNNTATWVQSSADYLPDQRLECEIFPAFDGVCAIDGEAGTTADLYSAVYEDGALKSVEKADITFDSHGRAIADAAAGAKLMLFTDNGVMPLAYTMTN